jgi:hypothetical protein
MFRTMAAAAVLAAFFAVPLAGALMAAEVCVACTKPDAIYRCDLEPFLKKDKYGIEDKAGGHVCETVLAKEGAHAGCHVVLDAKTCTGTLRTITLTDYQRAMAGDVEDTYDPGLIEKTRRNVQSTWNSTWNCVSSLFADC